MLKSPKGLQHHQCHPGFLKSIGSICFVMAIEGVDGILKGERFIRNLCLRLVIGTKEEGTSGYEDDYNFLSSLI